MATARRRVVDTSAWIEWLTGSELGTAFAKRMPARGDWVVPTIVQLELARWLARVSGEDAADSVVAYTQMCLVVPLDTPIALAAAQLHREHGLATADAIVLATARARDADLLTCDAHFADLPDVVYLPK